MYRIDITIRNTDENNKRYTILPDIDEDEYYENYIEAIYQHIMNGLEPLVEDIHWRWECLGPKDGEYWDDEFAFFLNTNQILSLYEMLSGANFHFIENGHEREILDALREMCAAFSSND